MNNLYKRVESYICVIKLWIEMRC